MAWRAIAVGVGVVAIVAGGGVALYATDHVPWEPGADRTPVPLLTPTPRAQPAWQAAGDVLPDVAAPDPAEADRLADAVSAEVSSLGLDSQIGAHVVDLVSGEVVYSHAGDAEVTPASLQKILTCTAVLDQLGPNHVFTTRVLADATDPARLTLVGGGDPMLRSDGTEGFTALGELAKETAQQLADAGVGAVRLSYDDSMFEGSGIDPDWESSYVPEGVVAPVSALSVDGGRVSPGVRTRSADPAASAAATFASMLEEEGVDVEGAVARAETTSADNRTDVASVASPPLSDIVEYVITTSNNDVAETLGRHVAVADGRPGTSDDVEAAVADTLGSLGIEMSRVDVRDGSGLSRQNTVPASVVASTLRLAGSDDHPELRAVLTGLPVAGFTGTLADRFTDDDSAVGLVRAKTGTLTQGGVHSLAGVAISESGAGYAFAVIANDVSASAALSVRSALDAITSTMAG